MGTINPEDNKFDNMKGIAFLSGLISGLLTLGIVLPASCEVVSDGTTSTPPR